VFFSLFKKIQQAAAYESFDTVVAVFKERQGLNFFFYKKITGGSVQRL